MNQSQVLAHCRAGLDLPEIVAVLASITYTMRADDPVCIALDKAADELDCIAALREESALWAADDVECKRGMAASIPSIPRPDLRFLSILAKEAA